jgi:hypothetical protein
VAATRPSSSGSSPVKPRLEDVTIVAADCLHPDLAARALEISIDKCAFADAVLFSDTSVQGRFTHEKIAPLKSLDDYTRFCLQEMPKRIATRFVLVVQWDGYVADAAAWSPSVQRYDYVGAPYLDAAGGRDWIVGNGGFSLRSRKLLAALPALPVIAGLNEDRIICQTFRAALERDHGIRFAPEKVADRFSFEQKRPAGPTFGFHGVFNLHRVEADDTVMAIIERLTPLEIADGRLVSLMNQCLQDGRPELTSRLFERMRRGMTAATFRTIVFRQYGETDAAARLADRLEAFGVGTRSGTAMPS